MITSPALMEVSLCDAGEGALTRAAAVVGAQAGLDMNHLADLGLVVDCLISGMRARGATRLRMVLGAGPERVEMRVGPLPDDGAAALRAECDVPGIGPVLDRLAAVRTHRALDGEYLLVAIGPRAAETPPAMPPPGG